MALDPRISLAGVTPDVGQSFANALLNIQRGQQIASTRQAQEQALREAPIRSRLLEAQVTGAEQALQTPQEQFARGQQARLQSAVGIAQQFLPSLQSGDIAGTRSALQASLSQAQQANLPEQVDDIQEAIELLDTNPQNLLQAGQQTIQQAQQAGLISAPPRAPALKPFAPITTAEGELAIPTFDPATGEAGLQVVPGVTQPTPEEKLQSDLQAEIAKSEIAVAETGLKEEVKQRQKRISDIKTEISTRNRNAARTQRTLDQALTLAQRASQGLTGQAKLQLGRLIPGIDVADEAALDATLKQLALDQLQQFKGPTTDFEFGVVQNIAGGLGQSQPSNIARIKSLKRANFFNQREQEQFNRHTKQGGDPDSFRFNFGEPVKTKKGVFTLQDIQDTAVQNNLTIEETIKRLNQ